MQSKRLAIRVLGATHNVVNIILLPSTIFLGFVFVLLIIIGLAWAAIIDLRLWS